jgi:hypothetical protein
MRNGAQATWQDARNGLTNYSIYAQKLNSAGTAQWGSTDKLVNQNQDSAYQNYSDVEIDSNDNAIIVWEDGRDSGDEHIYAQKLNSTGDAQWGSTDKKVNSEYDSEFEPALDIDSQDNATVVWMHWDGWDVTYDLHSQRIDSNGNPQWESNDRKVSENAVNEYQYYPDIAVDSNGSAIVVWEDERNGGWANMSIYSQKLELGANVTIYGEEAGDHFGWSVSDLGNVDSDSKDDIIIGAPDEDSKGKAYVFYGRSNWNSHYNASDADVNISGENSGDKFGSSVSGAGDYDNSDYDDIVVGAPGYSSSTGRV